MRVDTSNDVQEYQELDNGETSQTGISLLENVQGADAITADGATTISALVDKQVYTFTSASTNTGAVTLQIDATDAKSVKMSHDVALSAGNIEAHQVVQVAYNETDDVFEMVSQSALESFYPEGHLYGLGTSRETINDILIATGSCVDSTNAFSMDLTTAITKQIDANWAEGDDAGGFPTALTVTVSTWYHLYLIAKADGTIDAGFDTVFGNPTNLMSDASAYTYYRYIGSYLTDSGTATTIISYHQYDDWIYWDSQSLDETGNTSLTETLTTLTVPPIGVMANIIAELSYVGGACNTTVYPTDLTEPTSGGTYKTFKVSSNAQFNASTFLIRADTSMQIAHESDNGSQDIDIWTIGWYYKR